MARFAEPERRRGGVGAVLFLLTFAAIAYGVHRQRSSTGDDEAPAERQTVPLAADGTNGGDADQPDAPPKLPWRDQLDLSSATLVPISDDPLQTPKIALLADDATAEGAAAPKAPDPDPGSAAYVQVLRDGTRIRYTLDPVLQDAALTIFRNREVPYAAAVVLDLRDNAVLVLAGHSTMDPQVDPLEIVTTAWAPTASTFKLVTAAALLRSGKVKPSTSVCFHGGLRGITEDLLRDDPARDKTCATLSAAVAHSHNVVMAKLALRHLDAQELRRTAVDLGFTRPIPFEFPVERSPVQVPTDPIERAKMAAGFWHADASPLHGALLASVFAREGMWQPPHVVAEVIDGDGNVLTPESPTPRRVLERNVARAVGRMMVGTTRKGTARGSFFDDKGQPFVPGVDVAGKTGSITGKRPPALNYNWFVGFAPAEAPEIAFAVLLANEPKWRIKAHYAARRLVQIYLQRRDEIARNRNVRFAENGLVRFDPEKARELAMGEAGPASAALPPVPGPVPKSPSP
ncbi:MAG: penicillin-binding protein [Deltaproteobacteria bacterium]|nr:MAG: penicillin-binding protein [Deltaproteobacteria bacterium]